MTNAERSYCKDTKRKAGNPNPRCYDESCLNWKEIDLNYYCNKIPQPIQCIDTSSELLAQWKTNGLHWVFNVFGFNNEQEYRDYILVPLHLYWPYFEWKSWNSSYSNERVKSVLWTPEVLDNFDIYKNQRNATFSIAQDIAECPYGLVRWLRTLYKPIIAKMAQINGFHSEQLLLIGVYINACGHTGIPLHKDSVTNKGYGDVIVTLILSGGGFISFSEKKSQAAFKFGIWFGPGDCYIMSGSSRYEYFHQVLTHGTVCKNVATSRQGSVQLNFKPEQVRMSLTLRFFYNRERREEELFDSDVNYKQRDSSSNKK